VALASLRPALPYRFEQPVLQVIGFEALGGIGDRRALAEQIGVTRALLMPDRDRGLELEHRAALVGGPSDRRQNRGSSSEPTRFHRMQTTMSVPRIWSTAASIAC
jgi:hypothetical protein